MMPTNVKDVKSLVFAGVQTDICKMLTIWHDGSPTEAGVAVVSATIGVTTGTTPVGITLSVNGAVDARIGAAGVMDMLSATYNTAGECADHINSVQGWNCKIEGMRNTGLMSDGTRACNLEITAATNCYKTTVTILRDSDVGSKSDGFEHGWALSNRQAPAFSKKTKIDGIESEHRYRISLAFMSVTVTFAADTAVVYVYKIKGSTETEIHQQAATTATASTWTPAKEIILAPNEHILVLAVNVSAVTAASVDIHGRAILGGTVAV